ncbi:RNA degradosome polyphosphate kinase [Marinivivus vitaminiproducens]|uniref:RNA degradosome polyphosphate kinase n=1 Tax=Marinivivus vitaminiproducens TaxID=3035935 RepID=UPI00279E626E|nr:RNA degradosome polyphosphate kinase [Geminicoccaceae bacterium SCSIO 64248]
MSDADLAQGVAVNGGKSLPDVRHPKRRTETDPAAKPTAADAPSRLINRELSWLAFNERVMEEASNPRHPLLERVRFLSISASNLDEFYMVRVAGLKAQRRAGITALTADGLTIGQQLALIQRRAVRLMDAQQQTWERLRHELAEQGIVLEDPSLLEGEEMAWLDEMFMTDIFPALSPIAVDPPNRFPFVPNFGISMLLTLFRREDSKLLHGLLAMPPKLNRVIRIPGDADRFLLLDHILPLFLDRLFPALVVREMGFFRIIRDSDMEIEEEAEDLVRMFESAIRERKRGRVVRLTVDGTLPEPLLKILIRQCQIEPEDVFRLKGIIGLVDIKRLIVDDRPDLAFPPYTARFPERIRDFNGDCFAAIRHKDFVVHHPYESFDVVVRFLEQAARDDEVVAIKQTLYRTSNDSPIVKALIEAAELGKSVTALVELKARFDEAANIRWARDLERAGVQVVYGFIDLKTHAKISLVVRREQGHLRSYAHFGTGNYHPITAKVYTDLSFFTCDPLHCQDAARTFNFMTGYARPGKLDRLSIAPLYLRRDLLNLIDEERRHARAGRPGAIWAKMNSLVDPEIVNALYEASEDGVEIDLVVRGICCLRPGVPGMSSRIRVKSIVGRFLEHARIVCFGNGQGLPSRKAKVFIASADWMSRNLDRRIETLVPVDNPTVHEQVQDQIMQANLKDDLQSWVLEPSGEYRRLEPEGNGFGAHAYFMTNPSLSGRGSAVRQLKAPELSYRRS